MSDQWWFCLKHMAVEPEQGCPNKDRMGPYETRQAAADALRTAAGRNERWKDEDEAWEED
ncbi:hypothetical protein [Planomonospora parontospora]|uniref:hypothetical protein n=1 Tax=Planomonospora parontospora TaxID=58119 RepID=UPI0016711951|nr:hypothetical protein [Planomonospora parontospora]GGL03730.1 hypothetical protein GCM10014719_02330 [Planomonospora parontospora subsp. antibiotica]GII13393.1 hypothetical protein Ppa05_01190 [Planomonospora parontospora subsp. antibiotica]